ncbi:hypothetical protein DFJ63DRAFT_23682 [Scheffersomyces coipomensis]|uniref:uncharacterized protein n=1 Tax=Scheffersomyces coipomensis TaxID=1788519 RepID=UPI00315E0197
MTVISAAICTRGGKPLLARQFKDVGNDRITALLANLPSLITNAAGQHTTVEDDNVRFVYQPLEEFYIVLITNKNSNILQDIDTLHLFASSVSNLLRNVDEREIFDNSFEIIAAFDEVISLGYKENLTLSQVQTFLEMDSHEEKIQEIIERNKELEAAEERKKKAKEIQRKELARRNLEQQTASATSSFGNSSYGNGGGSDSYQNQSYQPTYQPPPVIEMGDNNNNHNNSNHISSHKPISGRGGLQLGKKTTKPIIESHQPLLAQNQPVFHHTKPISASAAASVSAAASNSNLQVNTPISQSASPIPSNPKVPNNGILITIQEKVIAELSREGSVLSSEVKGDLQLRINNSELAHSKILVKSAASQKSSGIQYKPHPNVDRDLFVSQNIIGLKDKTKSFPANDQAIGVLRWRAVGKRDDQSYVPLIITNWVTINDEGIAQVTLEYELTSEFIESHSSASSSNLIENIKLLIPIATHDVNLNNESNELVSYDISELGIIFNIESITVDEPQGSFEFSIPCSDEESLYPIQLQFEVTQTEVTESEVSLGKIQVIDVVTNNDDEESLPFDLHYNLVTEKYIVS